MTKTAKKTAAVKTDPAKASQERLAAAEELLERRRIELERAEEALEDIEADSLSDDSITGATILEAKADLELAEARVKAARSAVSRAKASAVPAVLDLAELVADAVRDAIDGWGIPVHNVAALPESIEDGSSAVYVVQRNLSQPGKHADGGRDVRVGQVEVHHLRQPWHGPIPADALDAALDRHGINWAKSSSGSRDSNETHRHSVLESATTASKVAGAPVDGVLKFHRVQVVPKAQKLRSVSTWGLKSLAALVKVAGEDAAGSVFDERSGKSTPAAVLTAGGSQEVSSESVSDDGTRTARVKISAPVSQGIDRLSTPERLAQIADKLDGQRIAGVGTLSQVDTDTSVREINGHMQGSLIVTAVATSEAV